MTDIAVTENCKNPDSYGEICVRCNKCGRFDKEPCEDAISREAVTNGEAIKKTFPHYDIEIDEHKGYVRVFYEDFYTTYPWKWWNAKYKGVMPPVQPSRKGHWITDTGVTEPYVCSECGMFHNGKNRNYCPNCGACMREGDYVI